MASPQAQKSPRFKIHERDIRGKTNMGWLDSKHTFSFGHFQDPTRIGFRSLRVINDDIVAPGSGFGTHPHDNMEIISYVLDGALAHEDSMGTGSFIETGDLQYMSAGSGVTHSEFNNSQESPVHFYQIWIRPEEKDLAPRYEQVSLKDLNIDKDFVVIADRAGTDGAIKIRQDAKLLMARLQEGEATSYHFEPSRAGFLQVTKGQIRFQEETLKEGDGVEMEGIAEIEITAEAESEVLLFDLA